MDPPLVKLFVMHKYCFEAVICSRSLFLVTLTSGLLSDTLRYILLKVWESSKLLSATVGTFQALISVRWLSAPFPLITYPPSNDLLEQAGGSSSVQLFRGSREPALQTRGELDCALVV